MRRTISIQNKGLSISCSGGDADDDVADQYQHLTDAT
jgi:hypothetical protein